jgi:hypothetical protein
MSVTQRVPVRAALLAAILCMTGGAAWAGSGGPCGTGSVTRIPEPASLAVLGAGVAAILAYRRRKR